MSAAHSSVSGSTSAASPPRLGPQPQAPPERGAPALRPAVRLMSAAHSSVSGSISAASPPRLGPQPLAAADLLGADLAPGSKVLACSGPGVVDALEARGFEVVDAGPAEAVVVGWHRTFDFDRLDRASAAVRAGARFVATNLDATYPAPDGLLPGNGSLVAAVATAAGRQPEVAGKPEPPTVALVRARFGERGLVVGDRPSTARALAEALGWPFALVVSSATLSGDESTDHAAAFVGPSLAALVDGIISALS